QPPFGQRATVRSGMLALHIAALPQIRRGVRWIDPVTCSYGVAITRAFHRGGYAFVAIAIRIAERFDLETEAFAQHNSRTRNLIPELCIRYQRQDGVRSTVRADLVAFDMQLPEFIPAHHSVPARPHGTSGAGFELGDERLALARSHVFGVGNRGVRQIE